MGEGKSFWTTMTGVLTAIGGFILALATLVTAMYGAGFIGDGVILPSADTPTPSPQPIPPTQSIVPSTTQTFKPLSFYIVPKIAYPGDEVTLNLNQPALQSMHVYLNEKILPRKTYSDSIVIAIPDSESSGNALIEIICDDGRSASQNIEIVEIAPEPGDVPPNNDTANDVPPNNDTANDVPPNNDTAND